MDNTNILKKIKIIFKFLLTKLYNWFIIKPKLYILTKKKERIMLNSLKNYLDLYIVERETIATASDEETIKELVAEYEAEVRKNFADEKAKKLEEKDAMIKSINELIERETEKERIRAEEEKAIAEAKAKAEAEAKANEENVLAEIAIETNAVEIVETMSTPDEPNVLGDLSLADL